jgi:hypothetical protein
MKCFKRPLWLAAWSFWLWLGFGLARELPRHSAAVICAIPLEKDEYHCGDLADGVSVTRLDDVPGETSRYRTWDAATGRLIRDWNGPILGHGSRELLRLGIVAGVKPEAVDSKTEVNHFQLLDLRSGAWTPVGSMSLKARCEHPTRPWLVLEDSYGGDLGVKVFDVEAKRWLFKWRSPQPTPVSDEHIGDVWFDGDEIVIVFEIPHRDEDGRFLQWLKSQRLERWHVPTKSMIESLAIDPPGWILGPPGSAGRILIAGRRGGRRSIDVVDVRTLKTVFSCDDVDEGERSWEEIPARIPTQRLSASGRTILSDLGRLWSVEQNRVLWRKRPEMESIHNRSFSATTFSVHENWTPLLQKLHLSFKLATAAVRDIETGAVQYRTFNSSVEWWQILYAQSEGFDDSTTHSQAPPPNWPLLALCQTILALPLMLLWAFLRWRRNRRLRLASLQP